QPHEVEMPKFATYDEYMDSVPEERRAGVERIRALAVAAAPDAVETISYDMPTLRLGGKFLVSWAAFKSHDSLFPASDAVVQELGEAIRPYLAGRGTIRFPADQPLPEDVVTRGVRTRVTVLGSDGS
ncbi:MAG: DUF1801 domain-containing protein, partial [Candidatus Limnocylindrales bacterium]